MLPDHTLKNVLVLSTKHVKNSFESVHAFQIELNFDFDIIRRKTSQSREEHQHQAQATGGWQPRESKVGALVRALTSQKRSLGSNSGSDAMLSLL